MRNVSVQGVPYRQRARRQGLSRFVLIAALSVAVVVVAGGGWWYYRSSATAAVRPIVHTVSYQPFVHDVTERGEIESSSNIEVRCEVQARNSAGTAVIDVVPEGTIVKKGDFLVKLDDSALQNERTTQLIAVSASEALVIQSSTTLETAKISLREYQEGTFKQDEETIQGEVFVASENLRRAQEYVRYSELLASKGYVTEVQLEADKFAVEKARKELDVANTKLKVIRDFTRAKMEGQLKADIKTAVAKLKSDEQTHKVDLDKLALIDSQIAKCSINAPADGQVVYGNEASARGGGTDVVIEPGAMIRERQVIIRLPDATKMQVKAKINEASVDLVRTNMPVRIRVDALPGMDLEGAVTKVSDFPLPTSWFSSNVKEYATYVQIKKPPIGMRPGMTAEVAIRVEQLPKAMQVPVQAIIERAGKHYCLVETGRSLKAREVAIGSTNDKFVIVKDGLKEGENVAVNPRTFLDAVDLPAEPQQGPTQMLAGAPAANQPGAVKKTALADGSKPAGAPGAANALAGGPGREGGPGRAGGPGAGRAGGPPGADGAAGPGGAAGPRGGGPGAGGPGGGRRRGGAGGGGQMNPAAMWARMIAENDKNKDGKLSLDEAPDRMKETFGQSDANNDGFVDSAEFTAAMQKVMARFQNGGQPGAGGPSL